MAVIRNINMIKSVRIASKKILITRDVDSKSILESVPALKLIRMQMKISKKKTIIMRKIMLLTFCVFESILTSVRPLG